MKGKTEGVELWGSWQAMQRLRLGAGYSRLAKRLHLEPGSLDLDGASKLEDRRVAVLTPRTWHARPCADPGLHEPAMVSRICRGVAKAACADAYVEHLRAETFPAQVQEMMVEWSAPCSTTRKWSEACTSAKGFTWSWSTHRIHPVTGADGRLGRRNPPGRRRA